MRIRSAFLTSVILASGIVPLASVRSPAMANAIASAPTRAQIFARLSHTYEVGSKQTTFRAVGSPRTIFDGRGTGTLTAVIGVRFPAADGKGQVVFFWHNNRFTSLSANYETAAVNTVKSPAAGTFVISYARYRATDPLCCPSIAPLRITYG